MTGLLEALTQETGMRVHDVRRVMLRAPVRYKFFNIPKRGGGFRQIAQPAREVKVLQRALVKILLSRLPVHPCATAYVSGLSIRDNALPHAGNGPILKLDLKNFFPSLKSVDWIAYVKKTGCLSDAEEIHLTTQLLFHRASSLPVLRLAIGAPSSPMLSNVLMYDIDDRIFGTVARDYVTYTRYADDMTFSAPRTGFLVGVMSAVAKIIRQTRSPNLNINNEKTTYVTTKFGRRVTGLTLSNEGKVTIGRERKRKISAFVHQAKLGKLDQSEVRMLAGMLAFVNAVEPDFIGVMTRKYGSEVVTSIQRTVFIGQKLEPHKPPLASY